MFPGRVALFVKTSIESTYIIYRFHRYSHKQRKLTTTYVQTKSLKVATFFLFFIEREYAAVRASVEPIVSSNRLKKITIYCNVENELTGIFYFDSKKINVQKLRFLPEVHLLRSGTGSSGDIIFGLSCSTQQLMTST